MMGQLDNLGTMDKFLNWKDFDVEAKNPSDGQLDNLGSVSLVKNTRRRFRHVADLAKRSELAIKKQKIQEKIRNSLYIQKAALHFIEAVGRPEYILSEEARNAGFKIHPDELAAIIRSHDIRALKSYGGVRGVARKVSVSLNDGVSETDLPVRENVFGANRFAEKQSKGFLMFVWDALHDLTLIILMVCALVSIGVGIATEGWPKGMYDGAGIIISIFLVVIVTATSDYKQSLQFKNLDEEKKKIFVGEIVVTRDGERQKVSINNLVVGDIVHLSIGDQVPADGIFVSGYDLAIDESSLSGESELVKVDDEKPFLLSGTKVQLGSAKMLVTTVGMRTEWGKLMEKPSKTPLQVKLNGVAKIIGKIGLFFAVLTLLVLTVRFLVDKWLNHEITVWTSTDALSLLNYFAIAVTVPEGLPLAVTLSLAFAMNKLMTERALVRRLTACETMGSASCICTVKTGTLTTNHMVVNKVWITGKSLEVKGKESGDILKSEISEVVLSILLEVIFQNTGSEVVKEDGKMTIYGSPTERAILEFGLLLGADFDEQRRDMNILKIEPFNSDRKRMSVLLGRPDGGTRAFFKGASEIILRMCNKVVDSNGEPVPLSDEQVKNISDVINSLASEALRTLCVAYKDIDESSERNIPENGYTLVAVLGIKDPVRPGVKEAVQTCLAAGITVRMVTGDNINTAKAIAKECGILTADGVAIDGQDFRDLSPEQMKEIIPKLQVMAQSSPLDKHKLVTNLRNMFGKVVAVTGGGTNDAPALHEADIRLAIGTAGTEVAKENADVIIMDENFATIVDVAKWGRAVYINSQKFVQFQLTVFAVSMVLSFFSACISGSAPLTTEQMLWVNMIMDTLSTLALATEPPTNELMNRPPVGMGTNFITKTMWRNIIGQSIYQLAVLAVLNFDGKNLLNLSGPDATATLNTLIFNTFVFCQVFNEINSRDMEKINIFRGMFNRWIFLAVMVCTVVFQVIIIEFLGTFASTVPLSWELWLLSILIGSVSLIVAVVLKCIPVETKPKQDGYKELPSGDIADFTKHSELEMKIHVADEELPSGDVADFTKHSELEIKIHVADEELPSGPDQA